MRVGKIILDRWQFNWSLKRKKCWLQLFETKRWSLTPHCMYSTLLDGILVITHQTAYPYPSVVGGTVFLTMWYIILQGGCGIFYLTRWYILSYKVVHSFLKGGISYLTRWYILSYKVVYSFLQGDIPFLTRWYSLSYKVVYPFLQGPIFYLTRWYTLSYKLVHPFLQVGILYLTRWYILSYKVVYSCEKEVHSYCGGHVEATYNPTYLSSPGIFLHLLPQQKMIVHIYNVHMPYIRKF